MDIHKLSTLIALLERSDVDEVEIKEGDNAMRVSRHNRTPIQHVHSQVGAVSVTPSAPAPEPAHPQLQGRTVLAPMVGTFYRKDAPEAQVFVEVGQAVKQGDTLCIIEAMKMMNAIEAPHGGIVESILVQDGQPVEFNQPLFSIV